MLFEDKKRNYMGRRLETESHYEYLDRSARKMVVAIRGILESWFSKYPENEKKEILNRLRSKEESIFLGAFFEIYLHNLMLHLGAQVIIHPEIPFASTKPDFLIKFPDGTEFYLEAKVINKSEDISREEKIIGQFFEAINERLRGSKLGLEVKNIRGEVKKPPEVKKTTRELLQWLQGLDRETVISIRENNSDSLELITKSFNFDTWSIDFTALELPEGEVITDRGILVAPLNLFNNNFGNLTDKFSKKAKRYGELDKPFILAINVATAWKIEHDDIFEALLGQEEWVFYHATKKSKWGRKNNGIWTKPGCQHTRMSGLLITGGLKPYKIIEQDMELIHNPFAIKPISDSPLHKLTHWIYTDNKLKKIEGTPVFKLLGFPETWNDEND